MTTPIGSGGGQTLLSRPSPVKDAGLRVALPVAAALLRPASAPAERVTHSRVGGAGYGPATDPAVAYREDMTT